MRITYQPWGESIEELTRAARAAEEAGADVVWTPELHRSATITAAAVAGATTTVTVASGIALAFARSPMLTALEALDLDEISNGRFRLGLGSGTKRMSTDWHGVEFEHPVERMAETVDAIRTFWEVSSTGDPIETNGQLRPMRIRGYRRPYPSAPKNIPIHIAGVGPRMIRLAGRVADGWLAHELCTPAYVQQQVLPELATGLASAGRSRSQIEVTASAVCAVAKDRAAASQMVAGHVGFYAGVRAYASFFEFHGLSEEHERIAEFLQSGSAAAELRASAEMRDVLTIAGTTDDVLQRVGAYEGTADAIKLSPPVHALAPDEIRAAQDRLIDVIAQLRR